MANKELDDFSFVEPLGHDNPDSKLERYWNSFWGPYSLQRERTVEYASNSNMTFLPMKYSLRRFLIVEDKPNDKWIMESFLSLVRNEFSERKKPLNIGSSSVISKKVEVDWDFLSEFAKRSDNAILLAYGKEIGESPREIASAIFDLLCDSRIGDKRNLQNNDRDEFVNLLEPEIMKRNRLLFVIPGFPFKDQNRFRVSYTANLPDLAEISFMLRLYRITQSIYQVHPFGADIIVLTDGELYAPIFNIKAEDEKEYFHNMKVYRNRLNLQATVSFISLKDLIDRANGDGIITEMIEYVRERLYDLVANNEDMKRSFIILNNGMKWNYNTQSLNCDDNTCWNLVCGGEKDISNDELELWNQFDSQCKNCAYVYAATNIVLKYTGLIEHFFPNAIRGTVHPKPNQFGLAGNTSYPWNGVAWSDDIPVTIDDIKTRSIMDFPNDTVINQFYLDEKPLFFTTSHLDLNYSLVKRAFATKVIKFSEFELKQLSEEDADKLYILGKNDPYFTWERAFQNKEYFMSLIEFRIAHYKKHGFGVYGVYVNNQLIGQAGLQVIEGTDDEIEWVIFLGEDYRNKGYGSLIIHQITNRCKEYGTDTLYAIVRSDNMRAIALAKKMGGVLVSKVTHYSEESLKFKIDLTRVI